MTPAVRRRRARRGDGALLRAEIMDAAEQLLIDKGDQGAVSIQAIADAVGVTPPSIYLHFVDKSALLTAVCEARFVDIERFVREAASGILDPLEALWARARAYVRFGLENPEHYRILFMTRPSPSDEAVDLDHLPGLTTFSRLVEEVTRCMEAGALAAGDPFLVATSLWTAVHGITSLLIGRPDFPWPNLDILLAHVIGLMERGLGPPDRPPGRTTPGTVP